MTETEPEESVTANLEMTPWGAAARPVRSRAACCISPLTRRRT